MDETKFGKYFLRYEGEQYFPLGQILQRFDNNSVKGSHFYFLHWIMPDLDIDFGVGHPPHTHDSAEILFHIGTNPDDPTDLGAEIEFFMGEEMERHVVDKTTAIFIPPNVIHAPWKPLRIDRPFLFLEVNQELTHTQKFYPEVLPEELRKTVDWDQWENKGYEVKK
jgi:hypothetical protein